MLDFNFVWELSLRDTDISEHILILYELGTMSPIILEIGAGQSTFALVASGAYVYSMDLTKEARERSFAKAPNLDKQPNYKFIQGNSLEVPWDKMVDMLFIDSGHSYDLTMGELEKYTPFVKNKGFIVMHDTGEFNNVHADCRRAMLDFTKDKGWEIKQFNNQNGLTVMRKVKI